MEMCPPVTLKAKFSACFSSYSVPEDFGEKKDVSYKQLIKESTIAAQWPQLNYCEYSRDKPWTIVTINTSYSWFNIDLFNIDL